MADAYWNYANARYPAPGAASSPAPAAVKRPRTDYAFLPVRVQIGAETLVHFSSHPGAGAMPPAHFSKHPKEEIPGGQQYIGYYPREEERVAHRAVRDPETLGASYDRYLHNGQVPPFGPGEAARSRPMEMPSHLVDDIRVSDGRFIGYGGVRASDGRSVGYGGVRIEKQLPPDASNTLFIEGLPADCSRREVSHIFRPFPGFREVRLVSKEARHPGGDPWVLCFVDFDTPSQAAVALDSLEGYRFDEHDRDSLTLRMQFSRNPGPRSGGRMRGGRR